MYTRARHVSGGVFDGGRTVKKLIWIVGLVSDDKVTSLLDDDGIPAHGLFGQVVAFAIVPAGVRAGPSNDLELMTVQMERVRTRVLVVQYDLDDIIVFDHD